MLRELYSACGSKCEYNSTASLGEQYHFCRRQKYHAELCSAYHLYKNSFGGTTMLDSVLRHKSKEFAKQIVFLCRDTKARAKESVMTNQLLRSATSIGANIHEAQYDKAKRILSQNWKSPKRNVLKQSIGSSFFLKPVILRNRNTDPCRINAVRSEEF